MLGYLSLRPVQASEWYLNVDIGGTAEDLYLAAGRYYNDAFLAGESLGNALQVALNTHSAVGGNPFTVTYDLAAGEYTLSRTGNFDIDWPVTSLRDWLGFTGSVSAASSYTSVNPAQGALFPESGRAQWPGRQYHYTVGYSPSQAGPVAIISAGDETVGSNWMHPIEPSAFSASPLASGARDDAGTVVPWTFLDFYRHHLQVFGGEPFRLYPDLAGLINSYEDDYVLVDLKMFGPERVEDEVDAYWAIGIRVADYVVSA